MFEMVLGFDARLRHEHFMDRHWGGVRREVFLLRPDIAWPKSVDVTAWPSLFHFEGDFRLPDDPFPYVEHVPDRQDMRQILSLWADRNAMLAALGARAGEAVTIRIDLLSDQAVDANSEQWGILTYTAIAGDLPVDEWVALGYDVADAALTSGLSNCGFQEEERDRLRAEWGGRLNDNGLFDSRDDAVAFRALSDNRIPEHAPFYVFALYAELPFATEPTG